MLALETVWESGHMSVASAVEGDMVKARSEVPPNSRLKFSSAAPKIRGDTVLLWTHVVCLQG